jgi:hypothetical protein
MFSHEVNADYKSFVEVSVNDRKFLYSPINGRVESTDGNSIFSIDSDLQGSNVTQGIQAYLDFSDYKKWRAKLQKMGFVLQLGAIAQFQGESITIFTQNDFDRFLAIANKKQVSNNV